MKMKLATMLALTTALWSVRDAQAALYTSTTSYDIADYPDTGVASSQTVGASALGVSAVSFTIQGLNGNAWAGDYTVALQFTDGTTSLSQTLFTGLLNGAASNNGFQNVTLSASGGSDISSGASTTSTTPITGPYGLNFNNFSGGEGPGNWILFVTDNQSDNTGTLTGWSLTTLDAVPEPVNMALGIFGGLVGVVGVARWAKKAKTLKTDLVQG